MHCPGTVVHDLWYAVSVSQTSVREAVTLQGHQTMYRRHSLDSGVHLEKDTPLLHPVKKKTQNIFNTLFRKRLRSRRSVFGRPLSKVCDENLDPPESIIKLMVLVYQQGPETPGILRRGNKATLSKEIRDKINSGGNYPLEDHMAPTAASVFKEFLRSIPEGLLVNDLYQHWTSIKESESREDKISKLQTILARLPPVHYRMLKFTICLLQHLAKHSSHNHMGPSNLAMCIAPSFCPCDTTSSPPTKLKGENLRQLQMQNSVNDIQNVFVPLISFMIVHHVELFGEDILTMFTKYGCQPSPPISLMPQKDCPQTVHICEQKSPESDTSVTASVASDRQHPIDSSCRLPHKQLPPSQAIHVSKGIRILNVKSKLELLYTL